MKGHSVIHRHSKQSGHIRAWLIGVIALVALGYLWLRHTEPPIQLSKPPAVPHQIQRPATKLEVPVQPFTSTSTPSPSPSTLRPAREIPPHSNTSQSTGALPSPIQPTLPLPTTPSPSAPPSTAKPTIDPPTPNPIPPPVPPSPPLSFPSTPTPPVAESKVPESPRTNSLKSTRTARASKSEDPEWSKGYQNAVLEFQVALARRGFFAGSLDGKLGSQSRAAIRAFQEQNNLSPTGLLTQETRDLLFLESPLFTTYVISAADVARLQPLATTWLGKSQQSRLDYETALEMVSELSMSHPALIQRLNPSISWSNVQAGTAVTVPSVDKSLPKRKAATLHIQLSKRILQAFDSEGRLMLHMPCSIGKIAEKRPVGNLSVQVIAPNPNYTFNPEVFPESEEARQLGRKLRLEPGPNNPVGVAWIGLDRPGYGIHGTPGPEQVGRTESHGCFRLANWNAEQLVRIAWVGLPVIIDP